MYDPSLPIAYDCNDLGLYLRDAVDEGLLLLDEYIQIKRTDEPVYKQYHAIKYWTYDKIDMYDLLQPEPDYDEELLSELKAKKRKYEEDFDKLERITVRDCLDEIERVEQNLPE